MSKWLQGSQGAHGHVRVAPLTRSKVATQEEASHVIQEALIGAFFCFWFCDSGVQAEPPKTELATGKLLLPTLSDLRQI